MHLRDLIQQYRIRCDAWSMEYDSAVQLDSFKPSKVEDIDIGFEIDRDEWSPINSKISSENALRALEPFFVIDGVQRMHMRLLFEHEGEYRFSGLGTAVVGALKVQPGQRLSMHDALIGAEVNRYALLGDLPVDLGEGTTIAGIPHPFNPMYIREFQNSNSTAAPVQALTQAMREREKHLVFSLQSKLGKGTLLVDGPLPKYSVEPRKWVVGYIKTLHTQYLPPKQQNVLSLLAAGERTPLFLLGERQVSWYMRLSAPRPIDHSLTGLVRLEVLSNQPKAHLKEIQELADQLCRVLPLLVIEKFKDARSPQNLLPIHTLEQQLKNLIGDPTLLQRRLDAFLYQIHTGEAS
ncbi:MAG: hypothetical protein IV090_06925 [Candidatus Sericytochromatia bacterium]|nr:hypothetical protein [Candidatus Sericytochromatia bacterium]